MGLDINPFLKRTTKRNVSLFSLLKTPTTGFRFLSEAIFFFLGGEEAALSVRVSSPSYEFLPQRSFLKVCPQFVSYFFFVNKNTTIRSVRNLSLFLSFQRKHISSFVKLILNFPHFIFFLSFSLPFFVPSFFPPPFNFSFSRFFFLFFSQQSLKERKK